MHLIDKYVNNFLEYEKTNGCSVDTITRYECLIKVYKRFIYYTVSDDADLISYLNKATHSDFFKALRYYIINNKIKSEDTCNLFISVLKNFFRFLYAEKIISGNLVRSFDHNLPRNLSFTTYYKEYIKTLKKEKVIQFSSEADPLNKNQIISLTKICNYHYENYKEKAKNSARIYHKIIKIIMIKLVILTGISQRALTELKVIDIDMDRKTMNINGINILFPKNYWLQIIEFLEIRKLYTPSSEKLFIRYDGSSIKGLMGSYLGYNILDDNVEKPGSVIGISKYTIVNMLQAGISQKFIEDLTGYKDNVIEPCQEYCDIGLENEYVNKLNKLSFDVL